MAKLLEIDPEQVTKLAERHWSNVEIGAFFGCDEGTIRKRFSEELAKGRSVGRGKLRDLQWKSAIAGNVTMQIWLGKQYLDQKDRAEVDQTIDHSITVVFEKDNSENRIQAPRFAAPSLQ